MTKHSIGSPFRGMRWRPFPRRFGKPGPEPELRWRHVLPQWLLPSTPPTLDRELRGPVRPTRDKITSRKCSADEFVTVVGDKYFAVTSTVQADCAGHFLNLLVPQAEAMGHGFEKSDNVNYGIRRTAPRTHSLHNSRSSPVSPARGNDLVNAQG